LHDGQAYLYPVGYDFTPHKDSLFLLDNSPEYSVHHDGGTGRKPEIWTVDASGDNLILGKRIH
jgi:hypothetical protein